VLKIGRLQLHKYLFQLLFSLPVILLLTVSTPVNLGCLEALSGHSGVIKTDKYGVVGPTSTIQTNEVLADGHLATNRNNEKYKYNIE